MRWQQRLRIGIAVFGAAFLAVLYMAFRAPAPPRDPPGRVTRVDRASAAEITGCEVLNLLRDVENFRVECGQSVTYPDGRQKLMSARVIVPHRNGRDFTVRANEAEIGPKQDHILMRGAVELTASDGLVAKSGEATFSQGEGILRAPGPTAFTRGRVSGESIGMTYDNARDVLWLLDRAVVKMSAAQAGGDGVEITSGGAGFARADHYVRYERGFALVTGPKKLASASATAYLTDDGEQVQTLEMRGDSRITGVGEGAGAVRAMESDDINLEFADDGRTLRGATLSSRRPRRASIEIGTGDVASRRVAGQWIDIRFAPDGSTVSGMTVRESSELSLPASPTEPGRTITSATLTATGDAGKPLNGARFVDNVEYREATAGSPGRIVRAGVLNLATQPGLGSIDEAHFVGAVRFEDGQTRASSGEARYLVGRQVIGLEGVDQTTGRMPQVSDGQVAIDAVHIELALETKRINARQDVRSVMTPATQDQASKTPGQVRRAGMLKQDQPVYATASELAYDGSVRLAVYSGQAPAQARLWQGDTTIQGDRVTVDDATGNLAAKGSVASTLILEQRDEKTNKLDRVVSIGSADDLLYEDAPRRATYTGSAHVSGPQGDLRAVKIELYLSASSNELDRVEGYTTVTMRDALRRASGDRLTFVSADGRYLMVGSPVKIEADCRETTGRTLTFYKTTNNIIVEPNDEFRTQVKSIPKCGEPGRN
jgi:lipopolysaccharide export system protein LptA